jgi:integrase
MLIEAGVGVKEIQQQLGHTIINITMNLCSYDCKHGKKGLPKVLIN